MGDAAAKLEMARGLLRRAEDRAEAARPAPQPSGTAATDGRVLPVAAPLARLLPAGGLRRGATVAVPPGPAATSLLWAVLAEASADGAWVGIVGRPDLGLVAAAEAGIRLERLALVPRPGAELLAVTSALLDGLDVVVMAGAQPVPAGERQRLAARARQRGAVLLSLGPWPGADVRLTCGDARWGGVGAGRHGGSGRLGERRVEVRVLGRGLAPSGRVGRLLMPVRPASPVVAGALGSPAPLSPGQLSPAGVLGSAGVLAPTAAHGSADMPGSAGPLSPAAALSPAGVLGSAGVLAPTAALAPTGVLAPTAALGSAGATPTAGSETAGESAPAQAAPAAPADLPAARLAG